jgi:hypothetical protein
MKKLFACLLFTLFFAQMTYAQVWSPQLAGHYGERTIYYNYGYYYGNVANGVANGLGTFYYSDGSFFYGNFSNGWWHGEGVLMSPAYGYLTGCWQYGTYTGECSYRNLYDDIAELLDYVSDEQDEVPTPSNSNNNNYSNVSPEGYKIKRIDPGTQMGKTLLGRYKN